MPTITRYGEQSPALPPRALDSEAVSGLGLPLPPPEPRSVALLDRILSSRGLDITDVLDTGLDGLSDPDDFPALGRAIPFITEALDHRILVVGDYDADGICSTALTVLALRSVGADDVGFMLANRYSGGYGISKEMIKEIVSGQPPHLLITVDHGTNSQDRIEELLGHGIKVLVLDHHQPGMNYQPVDHADFRLVNPHMDDCQWPDKDLCATAVAFFAMAAARNHLAHEGLIEDDDSNKPGRWLDMVALATVGDQMPMSKTNRILVEQGLRRIRAGRAREGIRHLLRLLNLSESKVSSRMISHTLVPRLNAAGRVASPDIAVDFLLAGKISEAHRLAGELDDLNTQRRDIERQMAAQIDGLAEEVPASSRLVCLSHPDWSIGVVGIGAAKLARKLRRPAIVFAPHPQREEWVGSGRAADANDNILACLDAIAAQEPGIFVNYGGHNQAVGATIRKSDFARFQSLASELTDNERVDDGGALLTDGELSADDLTLANAEWLGSAVVWGKELPPPLFDGVFTVLQLWHLSNNHVKFELEIEGGHRRFEGIRFYCNAPAPEPGQKIHCVYELNAHSFRGNRHLQLVVQHWNFL